MNLIKITNSVFYGKSNNSPIRKTAFTFEDNDKATHTIEILTDQEYLFFEDRVFSVSDGEIEVPETLRNIKRFYNYEGRPSFVADDDELQTKVFAEVRQGRLTPIFTFRECILHDESEIMRFLLSEFGGQSLVEFVKEDDEGVYSELFLLKDNEIFVVEGLFDVKYSYFDYLNGTNNIDDSAFDRCLSYGNPPRILLIRDKEQVLLADMQVAESLVKDRFFTAILSPHTVNFKKATYHYVAYPDSHRYRIGWLEI